MQKKRRLVLRTKLKGKANNYNFTIQSNCKWLNSYEGIKSCASYCLGISPYCNIWRRYDSKRIMLYRGGLYHYRCIPLFLYFSMVYPISFMLHTCMFRISQMKIMRISLMKQNFHKRFKNNILITVVPDTDLG